MDDLIVARNNLKQIENIMHLLDKKCSIKDIGILKYFLGMEVAKSRTGINVCQRKYALDLLHDSGLLACKPSSSPMDNNAKLHSNSGPMYCDITSYRRLIGKLIYLTHTRPDVSFHVGHLSQFLAAPIVAHYKVAQRILRYIKGSPGKGLFFPTENIVSLKGYSDSD
ncbi:PREDICTED: uncharacterized protein LOC109335739 [Lupinus angustifolius]|uniref:uncharacterized protein LOC109335739 n=1 Tax=Lupinus angustifolius TaxID=3871 RepID=UPI00092E2461|nr:PREDICTED: uncharacterized protein LOC109335739 [Lupinus angustifolius]